MMSRGGVIICGGRSRRMGRAKAWLPFGPERLLQRVVRLVGMAADAVVVVAAASQDLPDLPAAVRIVRDPVADEGPLRGLAAGLAALPDAVDLAYVAATDVPFLHPAWINHLAELATGYEAVIPEVAGHRHYLAAIYRRGPALAAAETLLAAGDRRLLDLVGRLRGRFVAEADLTPVDPTLAAVRNLNTPEDYHRALADAGFAAPGRPQV